MKGLSIRKTNVPKKLRKAFTEILRNDVLASEKINIKNILKKYDDLEAEIRNSLKSGNTEYTLPKALQLTETYKNPERIEGLRGAIIWNALEPENQVVLPDKINTVKLLSIMDKEDPRLFSLKENYPEKYKAICKVVFNEGRNLDSMSEEEIRKKGIVDISKFGFSTISFPKTVTKIPDYLIPFIDYQSMIANNMSNGYIILESLGINCETVGTVNYKSNIIEI